MGEICQTFCVMTDSFFVCFPILRHHLVNWVFYIVDCQECCKHRINNIFQNLVSLAFSISVFSANADNLA